MRHHRSYGSTANTTPANDGMTAETVTATVRPVSDAARTLRRGDRGHRPSAPGPADWVGSYSSTQRAQWKAPPAGSSPVLASRTPNRSPGPAAVSVGQKHAIASTSLGPRRLVSPIRTPFPSAVWVRVDVNACQVNDLAESFVSLGVLSTDCSPLPRGAGRTHPSFGWWRYPKRPPLSASAAGRRQRLE